MYLAGYPEEIKDLIAQVEESYRKKEDFPPERLNRMLVLAAERSDKSLMGFTHYHMAKCAYLTGDIKAYRSNLLQAVRLLKDGDNPDILAMCYNMIGADNVNKGNFDLAINHFLTARNFLADVYDDPLPGMIDCNIGNLYGILGDASSALSYTERAMHFLERLYRQEEIFGRYLISVCLTGWYALDAGNRSVARSAYDRIWQLKMDVAVPEEALTLISRTAFEARYAHMQGDMEEAHQLIGEVLSLLDNPRRVQDATDDLCRFCSFLIRGAYTEEAGQVLRVLEEQIRITGVRNLRLWSIRLNIEYARKIRDDEALQRYLEEFYRETELFNLEKSETYTFSIELSALQHADRLDRLNSLEEDVRVRRMLSTDVLTLLPSRRQFDVDAVAAYHTAAQYDRLLGIALIEIDGFADLKDNSSPAIVDRCIKGVAEQLRAAAGEGIRFYRHAAGRFYMIYENMPNQEIYAKATVLQNHVAALNIGSVDAGTDGVSITVSQGICNSVPSAGFRLWDFISEAEAALRSVREAGHTCEIAFYSRKR